MSERPASPARPVISVTGAVRDPIVLTTGELAAMPSAVDDVSALAPGAEGLAVRCSDIVDLVQPLVSAAYCTVISSDESYRASIPLDELAAGGWLAFGLDGGLLPRARGGPIRLTVAEGSTLCWNVKDVGELHFSESREADSVAANPTH